MPRFKATACLPNNVLDNIADISFKRTCSSGSGWQQPQEFALSISSIEVHVNPPEVIFQTNQGAVTLQGLNDILVPWENWNVDSPTFLTDGSKWLLKDTVDHRSGCKVETILYADELPQGMQWTKDEQKCREAASSSNIVGNTVNADVH